MAEAFYFPNPLDQREFEPVTFRPGSTVGDWLKESGMDARMKAQPVVIALNGEPLLEADWDHTLSRDDYVSLSATPQGLGIPELILWVATAATAAYTLYSLLTLPDTPDAGIETSPNNNLSISNNTARLGQPKPVLYGNARVYPDLSSKAFSQFEQNGDQTVYMLYEVSQGELQVDVGSMQFESTPLSDFANSAYEIIPPGSKSTLYPKDTVLVAGVANIEIGAGLTNEFVLNATTTRITEIWVDIVAPRGIFRQRSSGSKDRTNISFQIQYHEIDDAGVEVGGWVSAAQQLSGATSAPIQRTYKFLVPSGRYKVRINRTSGYDPDDKLVDQLNWTALRGFFEDELPVTTTTRIAVRIRSSDEIGNRALTKFSLIAQRILPTWSSGGGWTAPVATNSAAWAAADVLRNTDYGAGRPDAYINLEELEALDIRNAGLGFECNGVIDVSGTVWDALQIIGHTCGAVPVDEGGIYTMVADQAKTVPVQMFNMRNTGNNSFQIEHAGTLDETKDYVEVSFRDKDQDYRETSIDCILPGGTSNNPLKVKWWGIDNEAQAWELGMILAAANRYRRERVTFLAPLEGRIPRYNELVRASHYMLGVQGSAQISGDVLAFDNVDTLTVSEDIPVFVTPYILLQALDGDPLGPYQCLVTGSKQVQITEAFDSSGLIFDPDYEYPRFQMGEGQNFDENLRITAVKPEDGENVRVEAFVDAPNVYTITDGEVQPPPVSLEAALNRVPIITEFKAELGGHTGEVEVHLSWKGANSDRYDLEFSTDGGASWIDMGEDLNQSKYVDRPSVTGTIRYRVAGVSVFQGQFIEVAINLDGPISAPGGNIALSLASYMPVTSAGSYGNVDGLSVDDFSAGGDDTVFVSQLPYLGTDSVGMVQVGGAGSFLTFAPSDMDYNIAIPPNRRWLVVAWVRGDAVGIQIRAAFRRSTDDAFVLGTQLDNLAAADAWEKAGFVIDMAADAETLVNLRFVAGGYADGDAYRLDAISLYDVTDHPQLDESNLPETAYTPAVLGATRGSIWSEVVGSDKPEDNATEGATVGTDLRDSGDTVLEDSDVKNNEQQWGDVGGANRPQDNATNGADWSSNLSNRPGELTDGRVSAGLDASGDLLRNITEARANLSNILRRNGGGLFSGDLAATLGANWLTNTSNRPANLAALAGNEDINNEAVWTTGAVQAMQFTRDSTVAGEMGPRRTLAFSYKYDGFLGVTYAHGGAGGGAPYPYLESSVPFYVGGVLVATLTFTGYGNYGLAGGSSSRSGTDNIARVVWTGFAEENSSGLIAGDFDVDIGSDLNRSVWDGTTDSSIPVYDAGNYGGDASFFEIVATHSASGAKSTVAVNVATIADISGIK